MQNPTTKKGHRLSIKETDESLSFDGQTVYFKSSEDMSEIADGAASLVFTSPPYWRIKDYHHPDQIGLDEYDNYIERLNTVWDECYRITEDKGILAIDVGVKRHLGVYHPIAMDIYNKIRKWKLIDRVMWYIPNALPQPSKYLDKLFDNKVEDILIFSKDYSYDFIFNKARVPQKYLKRDPRKEKLNPKGRGVSNVIRIPAYRPPNIKEMNYHEAAFPESLVYLFVYTYTNEANHNLVVDPFAGSATTLKVSKAMGRKGIGYEINPALKPLIKARLGEEWEAPDFKQIDLLNWAKEEGRADKDLDSFLNDQ